SKSSTWARISSNVMATTPLVQNGYMALLGVVSPYSLMELLARHVVAQPSTMRNAINEQFVYAHLSVRCDVEDHGTLSATNRLLERWAGVFLNKKLAPLFNHLATELRVTRVVRDTAGDLCIHTGGPQAQAACGAVACPIRWPLQAIAQIVAL